MPAFPLLDAFVQVNSVDLTDHVKSVTLNTEFEALEDTAMGNLDANGRKWRTKIGGMGEFTVDVEFNQDFDASSIDDTVWAILNTVVPVLIKPHDAAVSATNPSYSGSILISQYSPLAGGVGELATASMSWPGSGELVRATS